MYLFVFELNQKNNIDFVKHYIVLRKIGTRFSYPPTTNNFEKCCQILSNYLPESILEIIIKAFF